MQDADEMTRCLFDSCAVLYCASLVRHGRRVVQGKHVVQVTRRFSRRIIHRWIDINNCIIIMFIMPTIFIHREFVKYSSILFYATRVWHDSRRRVDESLSSRLFAFVEFQHFADSTKITTRQAKRRFYLYRAVDCGYPTVRSFLGVGDDTTPTQNNALARDDIV
jgi:hypothetical protein